MNMLKIEDGRINYINRINNINKIISINNLIIISISNFTIVDTYHSNNYVTMYCDRHGYLNNFTQIYNNYDKNA